MQLRIARHTERLDELVRFYRDGIGLTEIGSFYDHKGYDGVFLEVPGTGAHLELTAGGDHGAPTPIPNRCSSSISAALRRSRPRWPAWVPGQCLLRIPTGPAMARPLKIRTGFVWFSCQNPGRTDTIRAFGAAGCGPQPVPGRPAPNRARYRSPSERARCCNGRRVAVTQGGWPRRSAMPTLSGSTSAAGCNR